MAFSDRAKKYWIIPEECLDPNDLVLGSILKYQNDPIDILNRKEVQPIDPSAIVSEREQVTKGFSDALDTGFGSKIGASPVLAAVLGASPFIEGNWKKGTSYTVEATKVRSQRFIPTAVYVNKALRTQQVDAFVRSSFFGAPVYMVVGTAVARTLSRTAGKSRGRGGGAGMGIGPPGLGVEVSAELTANRDKESTYHDSTDEDVILAYRLRRFQYSKRKDEFKRRDQDETDHACYSLEEKLGSEEEEGEEEDDAHVATFSYFDEEDVDPSETGMVGFVEGVDEEEGSDTLGE
ncbi:hypothetical protein DER45DRAFT_84554 [Fusarium avenaceum]|nr:hypothetical protein DER45DRAFT_84554 [Fusarium avenaceum]